MSAKQSLIVGFTVLVLATTSCLSMAYEVPVQRTLDSMADLFAGVEFDHAMHTELGEDCSACHHHTTGTGTADERCVSCHGEDEGGAVVACRECHEAEPFSAERIQDQAKNIYRFHVDKPGLKAAYHWQCLGCHEQMDGPTGCQDCHTRTAEGDAFYHAEASRTSGSADGDP
jgi:hypothetical protein